MSEKSPFCKYTDMC